MPLNLISHHLILRYDYDWCKILFPFFPSPLVPLNFWAHFVVWPEFKKFSPFPPFGDSSNYYLFIFIPTLTIWLIDYLINAILILIDWLMHQSFHNSLNDYYFIVPSVNLFITFELCHKIDIWLNFDLLIDLSIILIDYWLLIIDWHYCVINR